MSPQLNGKGGVYCADCDIWQLVHEPSELGNTIREFAVDRAKARKLWDISEEMTDVRY